MKIAHILPGFPIEYPGGITNYVRTLIRSQMAAGNEVVLATASASFSNDLGAIDVIPVQSEPAGQFAHRIPKNNPTSDRLYEELLKRGVEIAHFHTIFGFSESTLQKFAGGKLPYVTSLHDYYMACPRVFMMDKWGGVCRKVDIDKCQRCSGAIDKYTFLRRVFNKLDVVLPSIKSNGVVHRASVLNRFLVAAKLNLAVSSRVAELYRGLYPDAPYEVMHIGNESALKDPLPKVQSERIRVTYLGTFSKHKGGDLFLELVDYCASKNAPIDFTFYGKLEQPYDQRVKGKPIRIGGPYRPADIPRIMSETDIGVAMPIWEDNGPQVVMEMINYATPVLATAVGGIPDFIPVGGGFMFNPDDPESRRAAFDWVLKLDARKVEAARKQLFKLKTPEQHERELIGIYETIVASPELSHA